MKFCVIDTEGNGLFKYKGDDGNPIPADAQGQPRLASLSMILLNDDEAMSVQEEYHALVKPDGWSMTAEATAVNGLTDERLMAEGKPIAEVLAVYIQAIKEGFAIVAFNAQHDLKQMRAELRLAGLPDLFEQTPNVCVMRKSAGVIPRPDGKKSWPKLDHCRTFFKLTGDDAHTAPADAHVALAVLRYLHAQGVDLTPSVHYAAKGGKPSATAEPSGDGDQAPPDAPVSRPRAPVQPLANQEIPE